MSNMVVRTNVFALNAHRNLTNVGLQQRQAAQRLSSGFRINSAADDAAGLAISEAMRAQIRGLDQASVNTQDGVGLIQTAEGAMSTISEMVIRVRELMVQAANDTNTLGNREHIQREIDQIMQEINDVTFRTQFNTRTLLAGGLGGEGGGPASQVSLTWMLFDQARIVGIGKNGGIATVHTPPGQVNEQLGRHPQTHWNDNERTNTSMRAEVIRIQNDLNALARSIAERMYGNGELSEAQLEDAVTNLNFDYLRLSAANRSDLQNMANRLETLVRRGDHAAADIFRITQDQINALGGQSSTNIDGSRVFTDGASMEAWGIGGDNATTVRNSVADNFNLIVETELETVRRGALNTSDGLVSMQNLLDSLVGPRGVEVPDPVGTEYIFGPAVGGAIVGNAEQWFNYLASDGNDLTRPATAQDLYDAIEDLNGRELSRGVFLRITGVMPDPTADVTLDPLTYWGDPVFQLQDADGAVLTFGNHPDFAAGLHTATAEGNTYFDTAVTASTGAGLPTTGDAIARWWGGTENLGFAGAPYTDPLPSPGLSGTELAPGIFLVWDGTGQWHFSTRPDAVSNQVVTFDDTEGEFQIFPPSSILITAAGEPIMYLPVVEEGEGMPPPTNTFLADLESLFDMAANVLNNVKLESNAMWFQTGANSMQGTVLQLKGIHTGVLGGPHGDLAMLIDVREISGVPISRQLDYIRHAEAMVNTQRAQLGAIQNRMEFTRQSLDVSSENLQAAESRVRDTDMAREMMRFTQAQVLQQAGISMLAQANQLPSAILQLLQ